MPAGVASRGRVRFTWIRPPSLMGEECRRRADAMGPALHTRMSALAEELIGYMQANAPWNDVTGQARAKLGSNANITGAGSVTLSAFHGVPYGGFLETGTSKMSARPILRPALQAHYAQTRAIMDDLAGS
jgi:HK97 gp10 family phage protein